MRGGLVPDAANEPSNNADAAVPTRTGQDPSLRDVLLSIVTLHKGSGDARGPQTLAVPQANPGSANDDFRSGALSIDLRKLILDSELGGAMLRAIVDIKSADSHGATFSILGMGNFALDVAPDLHAAILSELSSGMAFKMSVNNDGISYDGVSQPTVNSGAVPPVPHERVNLVRLVWKWILDFLYSPVGALLSMSAAISVVLWICVKSVVFLQRRASRF